MKSIYFDDNWAELQQEKDGGIAETYQYFDNACKVQYTYIKRKAGVINGIQYYDILTPRGVGGPRCTEGCMDDLENYNKHFLEYCKGNNIIAEYVKFDPWNGNHSVFGPLYDELEHHGDLFCNDLKGDFLNEQYSKHIKRDIKQNIDKIEVLFDFEGKELDKFLELYRYTEEKYDVNEYYHFSHDFFSQYFDKMQGKVAVANAIYNDEVVSSSIILFGEDIAHYHFAGNGPLSRKVNANSVLLYKTSLLSQEMGKTLLDLGGGVVNGNTAKYKRRFVGENGVIPYYVGKRVLDREIYDEMIALYGKGKQGYFPEYRR